MDDICIVHRLGLTEYEHAWELQGRLAEQISAGQRLPTLLLLEHSHTYTFGRRGQIENLLWDEAERQRRGVSVHWVDRGGDVTYHGPGQLVGYPLLPLGAVGLQPDFESGSGRIPQADYVGYVRRLEHTLILALARLGVDGRQVEGMTGVWVDPQRKDARVGEPAKIAAIGLKVDAKGVTRHGFALNVDPDMAYWEGIVGCGLVGHPVVSLAQILPDPPAMLDVQEAVLASFGDVFHYQLREEELHL